MSKTVAVIIGLFMFVTLWSFIFFQTSGDWRTLKRLSRSGVRVPGTVTIKEPMNHASVRYDYLVNGVRYSGGPCGMHADFDRVRIGDALVITYLPDSPSVSTCEDPRAGSGARAGILFIVLPCFAFFASSLTTLGLYRTFGSRPRSSSN